jgi:hypothetical protein
MSQKGVDITLETHWYDGGRNQLDFIVPYHFTEYSPARDRNTYWDPNSSSIYPGDHLGDLELRHRFLWGSAKRGSQGVLGSLVTAVTAPTGLGEFQSSHPFTATGAGGFSAGTGLVLGQKAGPVRLWQQARAAYVLGYEGSIPAGTLISPQPGTEADITLAGGSGWIKPGNSLELVAGLQVCAYEESNEAYYCGLELRARFTQEARLGDEILQGSNTKAVDLFPQFKAVFSPSFFIQGGARYPLLLVHLPGPVWIEPVFRVGYQF